MYVRERLIRTINAAAGKPVLRRPLIRSFDESRRAEAEAVLSDLISEGFAHPLGTGKRGSPLGVVASKTWLFNKCPLCGQLVSQVEASE